MIARTLVVDLSHHNPVDSFSAVKAAGAFGIIHKATEGTVYHDSTYATRRTRAVDAGLHWGAYHFGTGADVHQQVAFFLRQAAPDDSTLVALDWEPNPAGPTMTLPQARLFLTLIEAELGRRPVLYSGQLAKEKLPKRDNFFAAHKLWLAQYGPKAVLPAPWDRYFLWQFTGDGEGPGPHSLNGIPQHGIDISSYAGSPDELAAEWAA